MTSKYNSAIVVSNITLNITFKYDSATAVSNITSKNNISIEYII